MARHDSPPGTFEPILKSVIEDPTWDPVEFRVLLYLATFPPGWRIRRKQLAAALGRSESWAKNVLAALARRGYLEHTETRDRTGRIIDRATYLRRGRVVSLAASATGDADGETPGQHQRAESCPLAEADSGPHNPRSAPEGRILPPGISAGQHQRAVSPGGGNRAPLSNTHRPREDPLIEDPRSKSPPAVAGDRNQRAGRAGAHEPAPPARADGSALLGEHLAADHPRPPRGHIAALGRDVDELLSEGHTPAHVRAGLAWIRAEHAAGRHAGPGDRWRRIVYQQAVAANGDTPDPSAAVVCPDCGNFHSPDADCPDYWRADD